MENKLDRNTIIGMLALALFLIIGLIAAIFMVIRTLNPDFSLRLGGNTNDNEATEQEGLPGKEVTGMAAPEQETNNKTINFNFKVFADELEKPSNDSDAQADVAGISTSTESLASIQIKKLGVNAPIIQGANGEVAIDKGWWLYPASKDDGEKIILAHRRYWKEGHPYSAWNINELEKGAIITMVDDAGNSYKYKVTSQSIRDGDDMSIFRPSDSDILKLITCSTFSGEPGSAEYRYITIAERVI